MKKISMVPCIIMLINISLLITIDARTITVAKNGTGDYSTINSAVDAMNSGDTVLVREGEYNEAVFIEKSGEAGKYLTIKNYPGELPILDGTGQDAAGFQNKDWAPYIFCSYIRIEGFYIRNSRWGAISMNWDESFNAVSDTGEHKLASHVEIRDVIADSNGTSGISIYYTENAIIEGCISSRNGYLLPSWSSGINIYGVVGQNNIVCGNVCFHNIDVSDEKSDGCGIILDLSYGFGGAIIENNICFDNGGAGIDITKSANAQIVNNTCYGNKRYIQDAGDFGFSYSQSFRNVVFKNNVGMKFSNGKVLFQYQGDIFSEPSADIANNHLFPDYNSEDPGFLNLGERDFNLNSTSPLIAAGTVSDAPSTDIGFDPACIKKQSAQIYDWWQYAPDIEYITSKGGLINCFDPKPRVEDNPSIGAYEYANVAILHEQKYDLNKNISVFAYQNSFTPQIIISYCLSEMQKVTMKIYDSKGNTVFTFFNGKAIKGNDKVIWNCVNKYGNRVSSGVYLFILQTEYFLITKKMVLL